MEAVVLAIKQAWEELDPSRLEPILAEEITWQESPYDETLKGKESVIAQWTKDLERQSRVIFTSVILLKEKTKSVVHWHATWEKDNHFLDHDGIFYLELNDRGQLKTFRQWSVEK